MPDDPPKFYAARKFGFDTAGPSLGPVQLLENTRRGFAPLPLDTIEQRLARAFFGEFDCADWSDGLGAISRAMNEGDLAKATIRTQFLSRPRSSLTRLSRKQVRKTQSIRDGRRARLTEKAASFGRTTMRETLCASIRSKTVSTG